MALTPLGQVYSLRIGCNDAVVLPVDMFVELEVLFITEYEDLASCPPLELIEHVTAHHSMSQPLLVQGPGQSLGVDHRQARQAQVDHDQPPHGCLRCLKHPRKLPDQHIGNFLNLSVHAFLKDL